MDIDLQDPEMEQIKQVEYWLGVEVLVPTQKARVKWLKEGEANSAYFHALKKDRNASNRINKLVNEVGVTLFSEELIIKEIKEFYIS